MQNSAVRPARSLGASYTVALCCIGRIECCFASVCKKRRQFSAKSWVCNKCDDSIPAGVGRLCSWLHAAVNGLQTDHPYPPSSFGAPEARFGAKEAGLGLFPGLPCRGRAPNHFRIIQGRPIRLCSSLRRSPRPSRPKCLPLLYQPGRNSPFSTSLYQQKREPAARLTP
jgi:hypothetical protein